MTGRPRLVFGSALVSATMGLAVLSACGGGGSDESAFTPVAGTESAYCDTYRAWQAHELDGEGDDQANPTAREKYWSEYLAFNETSLQQAPPAIRDEWVVSERAVRTVVTPVLEKYDFDFERLAREGTATERAIDGPPPAVQRAQAAIHAYEDRVCGTGLPTAADVVFKASGSSKPYCTALSRSNRGFEKVASSRFDPDVMRTFVTGDSFLEALDALDTTAPAEIAADVSAESEWY